MINEESTKAVYWMWKAEASSLKWNSTGVISNEIGNDEVPPKWEGASDETNENSVDLFQRYGEAWEMSFVIFNHKQLSNQKR